MQRFPHTLQNIVKVVLPFAFYAIIAHGDYDQGLLKRTVNQINKAYIQQYFERENDFEYRIRKLENKQIQVEGIPFSALLIQEQDSSELKITVGNYDPNTSYQTANVTSISRNLQGEKIGVLMATFKTSNDDLALLKKLEKLIIKELEDSDLDPITLRGKLRTNISGTAVLNLYEVIVNDDRVQLQSYNKAIFNQ